MSECYQRESKRTPPGVIKQLFDPVCCSWPHHTLIHIPMPAQRMTVTICHWSKRSGCNLKGRITPGYLSAAPCVYSFVVLVRKSWRAKWNYSKSRLRARSIYGYCCRCRRMGNVAEWRTTYFFLFGCYILFGGQMRDRDRNKEHGGLRFDMSFVFVCNRTTGTDGRHFAAVQCSYFCFFFYVEFFIAQNC